MAGPGISLIIRQDIKEFKELVSEYLDKFGKPHPALKSSGEYLIKVTQDRFSGEHDPDGKPWKPLSPATLFGAYMAKGRRVFTKKGSATKGFQRYTMARKILTVSSRLRSSITYETAGNYLVIGTSTIYAAIHQFGGKAGRGRKVLIPQRAFLGVNEQDLAEFSRIMEDYLAAK
jgi:phage virion morphogenesis protein